MLHSDIHTFDDSGDVLSSCAQHLSQLLARYHDREIFLLISGGSVLDILDVIQADYVGPHVRMCVIDDRHGVAKADQNYYQLSQTDFASKFIVAGGMVCDTSFDDSRSLEASVNLFSAHIKGIVDRKRCDDSVIISVLGIGSDGHTAGIMPYPGEELLFSELFDSARDDYVVGYDAGDKNVFPYRVTVNMRFLREVPSHCIVYAVGSEKEKALHEVLSDSSELNVFPAQIIHDMKDVYLYTDQRIR